MRLSQEKLGIGFNNMIKCTVHCDGLDCNTHGNLVEWLKVEGWTNILHFCSWNCLTRYGSLQPWVEEVNNV